MLRKMSGLYLKRLKAKLFRLKMVLTLFLPNKRGDALLSKIVGISIGLFVAGYLLSEGISAIYSANTTGWGSAVKTIFTVLLPILGVIAIALYMLGKRR